MSNSEERKWKVYMHVVPKELSGYSYDKYYIGITQQRLTKRWQHGAGYVQCVLFYNAIKKYGWDNMEHLVIADNLSEQEAKDMEIELINKYSSNDKVHGYNITIGGDGWAGMKMSEEQKQILREKALERFSDPSYIHPNKGKPISEEQKLNLSKKALERYANGMNSPFYQKKHKMESIEKMRGKREGVSGSKNGRARKVDQFTLDGEYITTFDTIKDALECVGGKCRNGIMGACNGRYTSSYGFIWKYSEDIDNKNSTNFIKNDIGQFSLEGDLIKIFHTMTEASNETGIYRDSIGSCCNGKSKTAGGYIWKFYNPDSELLEKAE